MERYLIWIWIFALYSDINDAYWIQNLPTSLGSVYLVPQLASGKSLCQRQNLPRRDYPLRQHPKDWDRWVLKRENILVRNHELAHWEGKRALHGLQKCRGAVWGNQGQPEDAYRRWQAPHSNWGHLQEKTSWVEHINFSYSEKIRKWGWEV